jgi:dihydroxyacetone kinase-like protein
MAVTVDQVRSIINDIAAEIEAQQQYLSDLDQAIGDGDHGFNMARGFGAITVKLRDAPGSTIGEVLKTVAMTLISTVGGASGPLYGTLFLKMSALAGAATTVDLAAFVPWFKEGIAGVQMRGKAVLGEKTMLDVLIPVCELLEKEAAAGTGGKEAFAKAVALGTECCEKTKDIQATKGRASYLGERSIGHIDPGATSSLLMIKVVAQALDNAGA